MPKQPRVFVVDDDRVLANAISQVLRGAGFQVKTFYDGLPAINTAIGSKPDVIVTDYLMPTNGLRLASWLRDYCPACKVVLISGDAPGCTLQQADYGYHFVLLEKPVDPVMLIQVVTQAAAS
ncbi:MAG: response regulator [Candidatus Korobacteraceae bacterium]|jgi:CheY-like chemotaxis protein